MVATMVLIVRERTAVALVEEAAEEQSIPPATRIWLINAHLEYLRAVHFQVELVVQPWQRSLCLGVLG
jgi:hypothetical protein